MKVQNSFFPKEKNNSMRTCSTNILVFLNDVEDYFKTLDGVPLEKLKERFYNELHIFLNYLSYYMLMSTSFFFVSKKVPLYLKIIPSYEHFSTTSNCLSCNINE
jgi:hypothetical protein